MSPDELDELLGLKPRSDMPAAARRSLKQVGVLAQDEGGLPPAALARQNAALVRATLDGNKGQLVSRWGHILLRRALASRLDAPQGMNPADFAASRAALLVRMGEGEVARAVVQDVDAGNYTESLTRAALDAYAFTADITGICPAVTVQGGARKDAEWRVLRAVCGAFQGDGTAAMAQLDRMQGGKVWPKIDMLLAQKYAGAAGKARRAVTIEWDGVTEMTPWRYAFTIATGLEPPAALMRKAPDRYAYAAALAPMVPLTTRDPRRLLRAETADLAVGHFPAVLADLTARAQSGEGVDFDHQRLFDGEYVCVMRRDHPLSAAPLTLDAFCAARHLLVSFSGRPFGFVDEALASLGRQRRVVMTVNQFATAGRVVAQSNLLTVLPRHFVQVTGMQASLQLRELPLDVPTVHVDMLWSKHRPQTAAQVWLREAVARAARLAPSRHQQPATTQEVHTQDDVGH